MPKRRDRLGPTLLIAALASLATPALAVPSLPKDSTEPVQISADQIVHDRDLNTVSATGNVEIEQGGRILMADALSYNLKQDVIVASGNVSILEPSGSVTFSNYAELSGDMKRAVAQRIRVLLADDARLTAIRGRREAGTRNILDQGSYTACEPCAQDPSKPPLWAVHAEKITHDEVKRTIQYDDAWLEIAGIPTLYSPYFEHPDPTIKRKSGVLPPSFLNNRIVGSSIRVPYFQTLGPYQDITLIPLVSSKDYNQLGGLYRWQGENGRSRTHFSVSSLPKSEIYSKDTAGWHIDSKTQFDLNDVWRAGWNAKRSSDRYYLRTFNQENTDPYLTMRPYIEGFGYRSYASLEAFAFQNLYETLPARQTANLQSKQPIILPRFTYAHTGDPGAYGGYWTFDTRAASINREEGTSSRRINTLTAWNLPHTAKTGELYTLTTSLGIDGYNSEDLTEDRKGHVNALRAIPQASLEWRFPLSKVGSASSHAITPIVVGTVAPNGSNSKDIPNEDSLDFELDDINVFSSTPFSGYDRVLTGSRVAYGAEYTYLDKGQTSLNAAIGQLYQLRPTQIFPLGSGVDDRFSDIVGRVSVAPSPNLTMGYRYRLAHDSGSIRRSEAFTQIGAAPLKLNLSYVYYPKHDEGSAFDQRQQIRGSLGSRVSKNWHAGIYTTRNIGPVSGNLNTGLNITYEDECLLVSTEIGKRDTTVRTVTAGEYVIMRFVFKTIAEFPVSVF